MKSKIVTSIVLMILGAVTFGALYANNETSTVEPSESANWLTDLDAAKETAKAEGRPLFLLFTGSDWCPPCIALEKNILSTKEFESYAADNLVLVKLDFPRQKPQSKELKAQNESIAREYGIQGFPTTLILSSEGSVLGKGGFSPLDAEGYVRQLEQFIAEI